MINKNLPEPEPRDRQCVYCFRKTGSLKGQLIHWPSPDFKGWVATVSGMEIEPFSTWLYICQWCRGVETKRKQRSETSRNPATGV